MKKVSINFYSHNGTLLLEKEETFTFLPRVGETITLNESLDNTDTFIIIDVTYFCENNILKPLLSCESFYPHSKGALSRLHYLAQAHWIKEGCGCTNED